MAKLTGVIRPDETRSLEVEIDGDDYEGAKASLESQVPEGWSLISLRRSK